MLKRNRVRTMKGGPMGDEAFVVVLVPTIGELRHQAKQAEKLGMESDAAESEANIYFSKHILKWNWVDDEGQPLPQPFDNPGIFTVLTGDELRFLGQCLAGQTPEQEEDRKK